MSNLQNDQIKENIFDELIEAGFGEDQITDMDLVTKVFFEETTVDELIAEHLDNPYFGEDMDGDHESALASAGFGTDEDYGDYGYDSY